MKRVLLVLACGVAAILLSRNGVFDVAWAAQKQSAPKTDQAALERARKNVKMLDDIYKTTVVAITNQYVKTENDYPAGRVAVNLFKAISEKGTHEVKLLDVSGKPYSPKNVAKDAFEKKGVQQMKAGKQYYEEVVQKDGKSYLRAMTFIPVVLEKCTLCHPHYKDAKNGEAIGAISYKLAIE